MNTLRRIGFPLRLAWNRLVHGTGRALLLALGIAAAAAALAAVYGGSLVAQDEALARALGRVPPEERSVSVVYSDLGVSRNGVTREDVEPVVERTLAGLAPGTPVRAVQAKLLRIDGALVNLAAADDLGRFVRLASGRLPRTCTPERCEVVQLGGEGRVASAPGLRFVRVGEGTLVSPLPFGRLPGENATRVGESFGVAQEPPFLVAEGFDGLSSLPALDGFYRTYAWTVPLGPGEVHPWEVDAFASAAARARSTLRAESLFLDLAAPVDQLAAARESGQVAGRRLFLVGGQAAALLLAFALLAAAGLRRDVEGAWRRLTWFGARRYQLGLLSGAETGAAALAGVVLGWAAGAVAVALLARRAGVPAGAILGHSVASAAGIALAALVAVAATVVVLLALRAPSAPVGGGRLTLLDVAALGALAAVLVTLARGDADAGALGAGSTGTLLLLLPGLVTFVCAVAFARLIGPGLRLLERAARGASPAVRLAALSLARSPGRAAMAVTFLVASLGLGLFAAVYRTTLSDGVSAQAAYAVPLGYVVRTDLSPSGLVAPLDAAPLADYERLGADVVPVIRQTATAGGAAQATLLGVPAGALPDVPEGGVELAGAELPAGASRLELPASVRGGNVALTAVVLEPSGRFVRLPLGETAGERKVVLAAPIPPEARGGRVVALTLARPDAVTGHGTDFGERLDGTLTLGDLAAGGAPLEPGYPGWTGLDGVRANGNEFRFLLTNEAATPRIRPHQPTDGEPVPVVVTPGLAARAGEGGVLPVRAPSGQISAKVVGVVPRVATVSGDAILADESTLFTALNAASPGTTTPNELWLSGPASVGTALERPPFDVLDVASRAEVQHRLASDPLARGSLAALTGAALVAALLALVGLWLLLAGDARDEGRELLDLEAQGAGPRTLRRHLRLRALLVAALGLAGGLVTAAVLAALAVDLVTLTANATAPEPPLGLSVSWPLLAAACAGYAAAATGLVLAATRRAV